jgi:3-oxoacyl-[acyl-carrier protein] reductase
MNQTVLIIGASGEIGLAIAKQCAKAGDQLILHYHSNRNALQKISEVFSDGQLLQVIQADLSTKNGINQFLSQIAFSVDCIIFASGKTEFQLFQDTSAELMDKMLTLHIEATWRITNHFLPGMIRNQSGKIICITSIWGIEGASNEVVYSTVKGAQNTFVKALAKEVAPSNIAVNAVSPGFIQTKMNNTLSEQEKKQIYNEIALRRPGCPNEVAEAVHFLLRTPGSKITGQILPVTGGWMI